MLMKQSVLRGEDACTCSSRISCQLTECGLNGYLGM